MNDPKKPTSDTDAPVWRPQRALLRGLHKDVLDEPVPLAFVAAAEIIAERRERQARWFQWSGIAAGVLLAFGAGWIANGQWSTSPGATSLARLPAAREFVHAASVAHAVYAPEKRHPVEVAAAEEQHLAQWLSKRLDKPLKVPDLSAQGYALVGGRLLPGSEGARAQFMFERAGGERITLYIGSLSGASGQAPAGQAGQANQAVPSDAAKPGETAFRFSSDGPVPSFYWVDRGFGYAIAGALPRDVLLTLAGAVYRQL